MFLVLVFLRDAVLKFLSMIGSMFCKACKKSVSTDAGWCEVGLHMRYWPPHTVQCGSRMKCIRKNCSPMTFLLIHLKKNKFCDFDGPLMGRGGPKHLPHPSWTKVLTLHPSKGNLMWVTHEIWLGWNVALSCSAHTLQCGSGSCCNTLHNWTDWKTSTLLIMQTSHYMKFTSYVHIVLLIYFIA